MKASDTWGRHLRDLWPIDAGIRFLNHGSYGAVPHEVLAAQAIWRDRLERQPVEFYQDLLPGALREAARRTAACFATDADRLAFVENASTGTNAVLASLAFRPGDEIVTSDHAYNAVRQNLAVVSARTGAAIVIADIGLPVQGAEQITAAFRRSITAKTRLIITDHVASATAIRFPVEAIIALGREAGIPVLVDGAHAPGMLDLEIDRLGATWYVGNLHKWMCAPRGAAFLVRAADAPPVHPAVISHGLGAGFTAEFDWTGTRDATAWLAVPAAIEFHERLGGARLRARNQAMAVEVGSEIARELATETGGPDALFGSMVTIRLPLERPATREAGFAIRRAVWQRFRIEVPVMAFAGHLWLRVSAHAYNDRPDYEGIASHVMSAARDI